MNGILEFRQIDILFAGTAGRSASARLQNALQSLDKGATRAQIASESGVVVGVAGANLCIQRGEIAVLMGLSGSGKSTLLRAANGLTPVSRGQVLVQHGAEVVDVASCNAQKLREIRRHRIAMVFQQFGLLPWRSVAENVGLGLELRGETLTQRQRIVAEKLELVGLSAWANRQVRELSGGMQQRVGLARAFATDAEILLMDEPFSALDPLIRGKLQDELLALQERVKKTIVFVSHDLDEALKLGDRISIMESGRIVQTGTAQDIVLSPTDDYVAEFVRHMNPLTVLTGGMIMQSVKECIGSGESISVGHQGRYQIQVGTDGRALSAQFDAQPLALWQVGHGERPNACLAITSAEASLKEIIELRQITGHPVLLTEAARWVGVCSEEEILSALSASHRNRPTK